MRSAPLRRRQSGLALVVALMMVILIGILGLSLMRTGTAEVSMVTLTQTDQAVFHVAESAAEAVYDSLGLATINAQTPTVVATDTIDERVSVVTRSHIEGTLPEYGSSLRLFGRKGYTIESRAVVDGNGTERRVVAGASLRVPLAP